MSGSHPVIAVSGGARSGKHALITGLLALDPHWKSTAPKTKDDAIAGIDWTIYTKYYGADVALHTVKQRQDATGAAASASKAQPALARAEAVVHVMNAAKLLVDGCEHAISELVAATDALDSAGCGADMRLLVLSHADVAASDKEGQSSAAASASSSSGAPNSSDGLAALEHAIQPAAMEHGFEVVIADLTSPHVSATDRDKRGVARVLEALQTVMWSSLDMDRARKSVHVPAVPTTAVEGGGTADDEGACGEDDASASAGESEADDAGAGGSGTDDAGAGGYEPPVVAAPSGGSSVPDAHAEAMVDKLLSLAGSKDTAMMEEASSQASAPNTGVATTEEAAGFGSFEEGSTEPDMEGLEALMQQALKLKMEGGSLTREERHEQAAAVALRMAIAMGLDKDEDIAAMLGSGK